MSQTAGFGGDPPARKEQVQAILSRVQTVCTYRSEEEGPDDEYDTQDAEAAADVE